MKRTAFALLAGGVGSRMMCLRMPKPLIPFGPGLRLIDFSIQNVRRSGAKRLVVMLKSYRQQIVTALLQAYPPGEDFILDFGPWNDVHQAADRRSVLHREAPFDEVGTADALITHRSQLTEAATHDVFVLHSDHVYEFDYAGMLEHHRATDAAATIGYQRLERRYVSLFGMVEINARGELTTFVEKPKAPTTDTVFTAVAVFRTSVLYEVIEQLRRGAWAHDISKDVIPAMLQRGYRIVGYPFTDFWADIGTLERYHRAQMGYVRDGVGPNFDNVSPTLERCLYDHEARSWIAPSATIRGRTVESLVYEGACVMPGADVVHSVLLPGAIAHGDVRDSVVRAGESVIDRRGLAELVQGAEVSSAARITGLPLDVSDCADSSADD